MNEYQRMRIRDSLGNLTLSEREKELLQEIEAAERKAADRLASRIMERFESTGISTKGDVMWIAEILGRRDVAQGIFRWFSTKGD